jgi:TolB-like protein
VVEIRRALGDTRQQVVRTMPRRGYLLIADAADTAPREVQSFYRLAAALAMVAVAIVLVWQFPLLGADPGRREAHNRMVADVAVLPLRVLNASRESSPDGTGLAYMIASELARNPDLHIVSPLATAELRDKNLSPAQIAAMTRARYLVDGSAERRGDRLQLHVQLIDSGNSRIVWSGRFEPTAQDLPDVTEVLISRISASLGATVRESNRAVLRNRAPASLDTHARALRAIALSTSPEGLREAQQELEVVVRLDPNYAPAWAYLGLVKKKLILGQHDPGLSRQDLPQAIADVKHAIALDPLLASSWRLLSVTIESGQNPESAESAVSAAERAIELGPGDPDNWIALANALHHAGRTQAAIEAFEKAISWSPLRPPHYAGLAARLRYSVQDYENALRFARECMDRTPAMGFCKAVWLSSLIRTGHAVEAEAAWPALVAAAPSLQAYQMTPKNTPMALSVDEDLNRLRTSNTRAMAQ